jgi:hypothetical protein
MNPIPDEIGKTTRAAIGVMRGDPWLLGLMIILGLLLTYIFYIQQRNMQTRDDNLRQLFAAQKVIFGQWGEIIKQQAAVNEKIMTEQLKLEDKLIGCVSIDDAIKLIQSGKVP